MKNRIVQPTHRVSRDAVTGELVTVELTPAQLAYQRVVGCLDRELLKLSNADGDRLRARVLGLVAGTRREQGGG